LTYLLLVIGGVIGALGRYHGARWVHAKVPGTFPLGTLLINLSGSLTLGILGGLLAAHPNWPAGELTLFLGVGLCGAYTTFSSFAVETVQLWRQGQRQQALFNLVAQPLLGGLAAWLGLLAGARLV